MPPGPLYSHILRTALKAKLDGETQGREAQLGLARELMRQEQEKKARHPTKE
jgi:tRNA nucleotidyltransferase (CCA-adding enzyme)